MSFCPGLRLVWIPTRRLLISALFTASFASAVPQVDKTPAPSAKMSFEFTNPALSPAAYRIEFDTTTGLGHYHSDPGSNSAPDAQGVLPQAFDQQIEIRVPLREQLLALARSHHFLAGKCEDHQHKVAFTGNKTIRYTGPEGEKSCTFNWSPDAQLTKVVGDFIAISQTLEEGRRLRLEYLHDRLSLDAELEALADSVKAGTALELENIAPELQAIASDGAVMKRAQMRAATLLAGIPAAADTTAAQAR